MTEFQCIIKALKLFAIFVCSYSYFREGGLNQEF